MRRFLISLLLLLAVAGGATMAGSYKDRGDIANNTGDNLLTADETETVWYNLDPVYANDGNDANTVSIRASGGQTETYRMRWPINSGDANSVLLTPGDTNAQLVWATIDPNLIDFTDGNNISIELPTLTPWNVTFVDANGYPLSEDPNDFTYYQPETAFGIGLDNIATATYANNYIQVYSLLHFDPNLFNATIGLGLDDTTVTGPNNLRLSYNAGALLEAGNSNSLGGRDSGQFLIDGILNTGYGYKSLGGGGTGQAVDVSGWAATYVTANSNFQVLDHDYAVLETEALGASGSMCLSQNHDPNETAIGRTGALVKRNSAGVYDYAYYVPDGGWGGAVTVQGLQYSHDGDSLYAIGSDGILYKFLVSNGDEVWNVATGVASFCLAVDSSENIYVQSATGVQQYDSSGASGTSYAGPNLTHDIWVDESLDQLFAVGVEWLGGPSPSVWQIAAYDLTSGGAYQWQKEFEWDSLLNMFAVITKGGSVYCCGSRMEYQSGVFGTIFKLDPSDGSVLAAYDTGFRGEHIWLDHDLNIAMTGQNVAVDANIYTFDDDLNLLDTDTYAVASIFGGEAQAFPEGLARSTGYDVNRTTAFGAYAGARVAIDADDGLYLGTYAGQWNISDVNVFFLDNMDRGSLANEKAKGMMYGVFADDPTNQTLTINAAVTMQGSGTQTFSAPTDTDVTLNFTGTSNSGVLMWMEDEDYFKFSDDILLDSTENLYFRDTALLINSSADGQLDIDADVLIEATAPTIELAGATLIDLQGDAVSIGENGDTDIVVTFNANSNDGVITWMEDEDYFSIADDLFMNAEAITDLGNLAFTGATELTISSGAVTVTIGHHSIDNEADAANDDLDTINGGLAGDILLILPANDARTVRIRHGVDNIYLKHQVETKSYSFSSPGGSSGTFYVAGYYFGPSTDGNLTQAGTTVTLGSANVSYAAHASLVAAAAGTATGGAGAVTIVVSGTSIDDDRNRSAADSETIVSDITAMSTDEYFETTKKWIGTITYTLTVGATGHTAYAADFNYLYTKYEDFGNQAFSVNVLECVGLAGANDTGFNIRLFHHSSADWTYAAAGFVPGPTAGDTSELANMNTTHSTEQNLTNGEPFAFKATDLNTDIAGDGGEGLVIELTTGANKAIEDIDCHVRVHTAPNFAYMATTKQHLIFMKHGSNWLEL